MLNIRSYYEILKLPSSASTLEIKRAYHKLAREYHPDSSKNSESEIEFQLVTEAYNVLIDPVKRREYDLRSGFDIANRDYLSGGGEHEGGESRPSFKIRDSSWMSRSGGSWRNIRSNRRGQEINSRSPGFFDDLQDLWYAWTAPHTRIGMFLRKMSRKAPVAGLSTQAAAEFLRGQRQYQFTIDALESLRGTKREVALSGSEGSRVLTFRIPAQVVDGEVIELRCGEPGSPDFEVIRARITVTPHELVERNGNDVVIKVPITIGEALLGVETEVPCFGGSIRVKIPPQLEAVRKLRIRGKGINNERGEGDLYVIPVITPPPAVSDKGKQAASIIDSCYERSVRRYLPEML